MNGPGPRAEMNGPNRAQQMNGPNRAQQMDGPNRAQQMNGPNRTQMNGPCWGQSTIQLSVLFFIGWLSVKHSVIGLVFYRLVISQTFSYRF